MKYVLLVLLFTASVFAQYQLRSPYLKNPERAIGYMDSCAKFWMKAYDAQLGGFYTNIDKYGTATGTQKNMQTQSRDAYGMVRAFMVTGNETFLQYARNGLQFMYQHAWDNTNGGWYWELDKNGNPTANNTNKDAFHQHYGLLGPVAYYEATMDTTHLNWILKGYNNNETKMWDNRSQYFGYYDYCSSNWSTKNGKSFNATVDAITTHLLTMYLLTGSDIYKNKMLQITDNMINRLVGSMPQQQIGFAEVYDANWNVNNSETMTIMGHVLKTAWCLGRVYQLMPSETYIPVIKKLVDNVYQKGYDKQYGGPYKDYTRTTGQMLMWGNPDTAKAWWQMEQAVTGGLMTYEITQDEQYLKIADETLDFFMKYFVDHVYGDVYENRTRRGAQTWGENKGNGNKAGYHSIELGYYTYLYGNFFVAKKPVTLYYYFAPASINRTIQLNPVEIASAKYEIKEVTLNGTAFTAYDAQAKQLALQAGSGGKFKVTFALTSAGTLANNNLPKTTELKQNYPNPFNASTVITYTLPRQGEVSLSVYDLLGTEVTKLVNEEKQAGTHKISFNAGSLPSGVYFYRLSTGSMVQTKKFVVMK
ncbi:MAG: AGE family epimerase/isomerase [Ignavibacteriales bacterium]|nr:AGE family epimerase/isomerase [Ignavibacteriales bacterium]